MSQPRLAWLATLAKLVAPYGATDAARKLGAMLPSVQHLPDIAFTPPIAEAVAAKLGRGVPTAEALVTAFEAEFRAAKPEAAKQTRLDGGLDARIAALPIDARLWVKYWNDAAAAGFCQCTSNGCTRTARHRASVLRSRDRSGVAWKFICNELEGQDRMQVLLRNPLDDRSPSNNVSRETPATVDYAAGAA